MQLFSTSGVLEQHKFKPEDMISFDETPAWADMVFPTTVEFSGSNDVPVVTTGQEKVHVTVGLAARGDGTK